MAAPAGLLIVPVGFRADGTLRALELTDSDELKVYVASTVMDDMLTALEKIDDLRNALDSVGTDELDVNIEASVLPTGAATSAAQATTLTELQAKLETADLELVTKILSTGSHGWIGAALQKQPMIRGYSKDKTQSSVVDPADAGTNSIFLDTVPAGEIWDVQFINGIDIDTSITDIQFVARINGISITVQFDTSPSKDYDTMWSGNITLSEGDGIRVYFHGCVAGDLVAARFHAVVTEINQ